MIRFKLAAKEPVYTALCRASMAAGLDALSWVTMRASDWSAVLDLPHGFHSSIRFADYCAMRFTNYSSLKTLAHSPLHYRHAQDNRAEATSPMRLGTAAHAATLEPHRFESDFAVWNERKEDGDLKARRGKEWDAFVARYADKTIVRADEYEIALAIGTSVRCHPDAGRYLKAGEAEVTMRWRDAETGRECKGRVDWLGGNVVVGLKTARDSRNVAFGNQSHRLGYAIQWAMYHDAFEAITGKPPAKMVEIAVEPTAPHDVGVYTIPDEILDLGRAEYRALLVLLGECERDDHWPGATPREQPLTFPTRAFAAEDDIAVLGFES